MKLFKFRQIKDDAQALLDERGLPPERHASKWRHFAHFWVLVGRSFARNRCPVRASALAYATLLALIPMLAVAVSVTSSFLKQEGEERIDQFIGTLVASLTPPAGMDTNSVAVSREREAAATTNSTAELPRSTTNSVVSFSQTNALATFGQDQQIVAARKAVARNIHDFIQNTRSGALGVTGSALLIFAAISMLSRIETTFNDIWGVARGRTWFMRIVLYWGVLSLAPLLLVVALGLATGPHLQSTKHFLAALPFIGNFIFHFCFHFLPVVVLCGSFGAFYMLIPNTKVDWRAALVGGLVGGVLFHLNNLASVLYVSRVVSNSKIYGSLGLVPVFMIGLYLSWLILLFGAQVAYAFQNRSSYLEEKQVETINQRGREFVALRLMTLIGQRYLLGQPAPTIAGMGDELHVPIRLARQVLQTLATARLVVETSGADPAFLPARPLDQINCHDILLALRATQGQELATRDEPARGEVYGEFQRIQDAEREAASGVSLLALAHRAQPKQVGGGTGPGAG